MQYKPELSQRFSSPAEACYWAVENASGSFVAYIKGYEHIVRVSLSPAFRMHGNFLNPKPYVVPAQWNWDYGCYSEVTK